MLIESSEFKTFKKFHILIVLSSETEIIYLLSVLIAKLVRLDLCPSKTVSCVFSARFHTLIELSAEPETTYL